MFPNNFDESLLSPTFLYHPGGEYADSERKWQGIPGIERTKGGRLYFGFYSGGVTEQPGNFVLLIRSDDDGKTFSAPFLAVVPPTPRVRCFDECLWIDPKGRFHLFWAQSYKLLDGRVGVWEAVCDDPDADEPVFSAPRRIANGIMMNKPIVLSTGEWLLTCGIYEGMCSKEILLAEERFSNVYVSRDEGGTFVLSGHTDYKDRLIDEHMNVERKDGSVWMLIRGRHGIGQAFSYDKGETWTEAEDSGLGGPGSRFCIRRLKSGRLLLINHHDFTGRNNLKAMLSDDDGKTWQGYLMLDERSQVSYPDMTEDDAGNLYITYDFERYGARDILLAKVTEADILAGRLITPTSFLRRVANHASGEHVEVSNWKDANP